MTFTTPINIPHSVREITYDDKILMLGSCFTENISQKMKEAYFRVAVNPTGIMYNPLSIARSVEWLLSDSEPDSVFHNGLYHSFLHHGDFSYADRQEFDAKINQSREYGRKALEEASVLIVTFGTAWVYEKDGTIVANCHKLPADRFSRRRLKMNEIIDCWQELLAKPQLQGKHFIFTVSPIRHLKDGLHENQLSKATLLLACDILTNEQSSPNRQYFPSYELLLDELRDYRFYAEDMLHPSTTAVEYIWQRFSETCFSQQTLQEMRPLQQLYKDLHHRPLHADSPEHLSFLQQTEEKARALRLKYPWI